MSAALDLAIRDPEAFLELDDRLWCERSFRRFIRWAWPIVEPGKPIVDGWYIDAIADHLQAVSEDHIKRLLICIRPRMAKSTICSVMWQAWEWTRSPHLRFLTASYSQDRVLEDATRTRDLIQSADYQRRWGNLYQMASDQNVKGRFRNTRQGHRYTCVVGGGGTGDGGERLLYDDPMSATGAMSSLIKAQAFAWHYNTFMTRRNDPETTPVIGIGQRLDVDDLWGQLIEAEPNAWELLILETRKVVVDMGAIATRTYLSERGMFKDPRQPGELLSTRIPPEEADTCERIRPFEWASQEQQRPIRRNAEDRKFQGYDPATCLCVASDIVDPAKGAGWKFGVGIDHGDGKGKECAILIAWHEVRQKVVVVDEYISQRATTPEEDAAAIRMMIEGRNGLSLRRVSKWVGDINPTFKGDGDNINVRIGRALDVRIHEPAKESGSVETGVMLMDQAFRSGALVVDEDCKWFIACMGNHTKKGDRYTDAADAARYLARGILSEMLYGKPGSAMY